MKPGDNIDSHKEGEKQVTGKAATIGFFDGVHLGHRFLIDELRTIADNCGLKSLIITFPIHPRKVLDSDYQPELLNTLSEKLDQLHSTGTDDIALLDFSKELAQMSAYKFMKEVLRKRYNVEVLLIGYDHRFGHNREETFSDYQHYGSELGIEVVLASHYSIDANENISSSHIRRSIENGDIAGANKMLGYNYTLEGKVVNGFKIGRKIGFPTANLQPVSDEKLIPAIGVYAVRTQIEGRTYLGMLNIGSRPTLNNGNNITIEVHIIGFDRNIYNEVIKVEFLDKIRDEQKFNSVEELIEQMHRDKEKVELMGEGFIQKFTI